MKHLLIIIITLLASIYSSAASPSGVGEESTLPSPLSVPDSILPYVLKEKRAAYLVDSSSNCQLRRIDAQRVCLLRHVMTPEVETICYIYDNQWQLLSTQSFDDITLTHRPDTMSQERYEELLHLIEFPLVEARFATSAASAEEANQIPEDPLTLSLSLNVPMITDEQRKQLKEILVQKNVKWNGETFKED
jgi:hypothetical protein